MVCKLASNLKTLRTAFCFTIRDVEQHTGISNAYLSQLESGKRTDPGIDVVSKLATFYSCSIDDLINKEVIVEHVLKWVD